MNQMTRNLFSLFVFAVLLVASGCSSDVETDSETHWQSPLGACTTSSDCQNDLDCICGVCTSTCNDSSSACGEVDSAAECVVDEQQLPARCASQASGGGGVCLEPCTSNAACEQRDSALTCENGRCASPEHGERPDGGPRDTDGGTSDADAETGNVWDPLLCDEGPAICCDELDLPSGDVPFAIHEGPEIGYTDNGTPSVTSGIWHGMRALEQPEAVSCPQNTEFDLPCQLDQVGVFEDAQKVERTFLIGLPNTLLSALPEDVAVNLEGRNVGVRLDLGRSNPGERRIVRQEDNVPLLAVGGYFDSQFDTYAGFALSPATDPSEADQAVCMTRTPDECGRLYVYPRLHIVADQEHLLEPGEEIDFTAQGQRYRLWHVISEHRYTGSKSGWGGCADAMVSTSSYALIWLGEAS